MNERDIELAKQAGFDSFDIELFQSIVKLADIIRADEREACADIVDNADTPDCGGWTFGSISNAIRARGNT